MARSKFASVSTPSKGSPAACATFFGSRARGSAWTTAAFALLALTGGGCAHHQASMNEVAGMTYEKVHYFQPKIDRAEGETGQILPSSTPQQQVVSAGLSNGQIVRVNETIQNVDLAGARVVVERTKDPRVKQFAERVRDDSKRQKQATTELARGAKIAPIESAVSTDMRVKASQQLTSVELSRPEEFDRAFIEVQVEQNQERLQLMNERLIPEATDPALKAELTKSRTVLQRQLRDALDIQRGLNANQVPAG